MRFTALLLCSSAVSSSTVGVSMGSMRGRQLGESVFKKTVHNVKKGLHSVRFLESEIPSLFRMERKPIGP